MKEQPQPASLVSKFEENSLQVGFEITTSQLTADRSTLKMRKSTKKKGKLLYFVFKK